MKTGFDFLSPQAEAIHFIGIGGISMSSLALISQQNGYKVTGSDTGDGDTIALLKSHGITVYPEHSEDNLPAELPKERVAVVYTAAIAETNIELNAAKSRGFKIYSRAEFLGKLMNSYKYRIGVSGTHGKSTVCGMLNSIYTLAGRDPSIICGAEIPDIGGAYRYTNSDRLIFEACEYRDSFLSFSPTVAAVTNAEAEHLDYFKDIKAIENSFRRYIYSADTAVINSDDPLLRKITAPNSNFPLDNSTMRPRILTVSVYDRSADMYASETTYCAGFATFKLMWHGRPMGNVRLCVAGKHNVSNALIAAAVAFQDGISPEIITEALSSFRGIKRRMELRGKYNGAVIYDDYAHHPTEIRATLTAAREMGFRFISCAFQPHTYSRTALMFCDFVRSLELADEVLVADIYAAREENTYGITSRDLACAIRNGHYLPTPRLIAEHFKNIASSGVLLLTMGAGRLDRVADIILDPAKL